MTKTLENSSPKVASAEGEQAVDKPGRMPRGEDFLRDLESAEQIASLAYTGATDGEIADYLELSLTAMRAKFAKQLKRGRAAMRIGLRKKQLQLATGEEGDVRLLQFLGKHYLGQSEGTGEAAGAEPVKTYRNVRLEDV